MWRDRIETALAAATVVAALAALSWRPTAADAEVQLAVLAGALAGLAAFALASRRAPWLPWPALALLAWMGWQLAPLPLDWLTALAPRRAADVEAALTVGAAPGTTLAAAASAAMRGAVILLGIVALFALARRASAGGPRCALVVAGALATLGAFQAALGLQQYMQALSSGEAETLARGTFVNRGQLGAFLLAALGPTVGWLLSQDRRKLEALLGGAALSVMLLTGLAASLSRAALAAGAVTAIAGLASGGRRSRWGGAAAAALVVALLATTDFGGRIQARFARLAVEQGDPGRRAVWRDAAPLAVQSAVWGVGRGGFAAAFERSRPYLPRKSVQHAHSDALELGIELGATGFLLLAGGVLWAFLRVARSEPPPLVWGCLAGAAGPFLQGLADLPLQSPAVAGAAACCLGLAVGRVDATAETAALPRRALTAVACSGWSRPRGAARAGRAVRLGRKAWAAATWRRRAAAGWRRSPPNPAPAPPGCVWPSSLARTATSAPRYGWPARRGASSPIRCGSSGLWRSWSWPPATLQPPSAASPPSSRLHPRCARRRSTRCGGAAPR